MFGTALDGGMLHQVNNFVSIQEEAHIVVVRSVSLDYSTGDRGGSLLAEIQSQRSHPAFAVSLPLWNAKNITSH